MKATRAILPAAASAAVICAAELVLAAPAAGYTSRRVVAGSPGGTTGPGA